jgi:hypothetical protein
MREAFMAEPGDIAALSGFLALLAENDDVRLAAGRAAKQRAQSFPTWDVTAAAFFGALRRTWTDARR